MGIAVQCFYKETPIQMFAFHLISICPDVHVVFRCTVVNAVGNLPHSWSINLSHPGLGKPFPPGEACRDVLSTTATSEHSHNSTPWGLKDQIRLNLHIGLACTVVFQDCLDSSKCFEMSYRKLMKESDIQKSKQWGGVFTQGGVTL